jgi:hypothetical protein
MKSLSPPEIICRELPPFNASNLDAVCAAFQSADVCPLQQAWLPVLDAGFEETEVRAGWRGNSLWLLVEVADAHIFTRATGHNQPFWELGDTIEIFLQSPEQAGYVEFQVTPNNLRCQMRFTHPDQLAQARQSRSLEHVLIRDQTFQSRTWLEPQNCRWFVLAEIPAQLVSGKPDLSRDSQWLFSLGRYEYGSGEEEPVISSTSAHGKLDFHRLDDWGTLQFQRRDGCL